MNAHDFFLIVHLLLFCYWLGGDMGVFYSSGFVINPKLTPPARMTAAKIMVNLDLVPRICMALMLTVGGVLSSYEGLEHPDWQWPLIILLAPVWLFMVLFIHWKEGTPAAKAVTRIDFWFRWVVVISILASVTYAFSTGRLDPAPWVGVKLVVFAAMVFSGLMIRMFIGPYVAGIHALAKGSITDAENVAMSKSLAQCRIFVYVIWAGLLVECILGVVKPGSPEVGTGMEEAVAWFQGAVGVLLSLFS
jgi:hypothetical protein